MSRPGRPDGESRGAQHAGRPAIPSNPGTAPGPAGAPTGWAAQRERGNLLGLRLLRRFAITAGRPLARVVLLHPIALAFLLFDRDARHASRLYLGRALGRPASWRDVHRHLHHFAATVLDRVYFLQGRHAEFEIEARGIEIARDPLLRGEGVLLAGAHLGSFEALRAIGDGHGMRVAMLMYEDNARLINATLAAVAPEATLTTIALGRPGAMLELRRWLDGGGLAGMLADRTLPGRSERSRVWPVDFLGRPARFADGPFRLAAMLRQRLAFMTGLYHGGRRYELRFIEIADFRAGAATDGLDLDGRVHRALLNYVRLLESICRETPFNWFNFYDFWADDAEPETP